MNNAFVSKMGYVIGVVSLGYSFCFLMACDVPREQRLSTVKFHAASVMPVVWRHAPGQPLRSYVLLSREAGGKDKGTYDDWGGSRDKGDQHPRITAAREFLEEAITAKTLGMSFSDIKKYIDVENKTGRTINVVVQEGVGGKSTMVTYITEFESERIEQLIKKFYKARQEAKSWKYKEKDCLALIPWTCLSKTLCDSKNAKNVRLAASVVDSDGNQKEETITLRPAFVAKLRSLFKGRPHTDGESKKVLFFPPYKQKVKSSHSEEPSS